MIKSLIANASLIVSLLLITEYFFRKDPIDVTKNITTKVKAGIVTGILGSTLLLYSINLDDSMMIDMRYVALALVAIYGGIITATITAMFLSITRVLLYGLSTTSLTDVLLLLFFSIVFGIISNIKGWSFKQKFWTINILSLIVTVTNIAIVIHSPLEIILSYGSLSLIAVVFSYIVVMNIKKSNRLERYLIESDERYRSVVELSPQPIVLHQEGKIIYANPSAKNTLKVNNYQLLGKPILKFVHPDDRKLAISRVQQIYQKGHLDNTQYRLVTLEEKTIYVELKSSIMNIDGKPTILLIGEDITERLNAEKKIKYMALHDALTGLPNRHMLEKYLTNALARSKHNKSELALLFLDLDRFKFINDSKGHEMGDQLLKQVAERLTTCIPEGHTIARQGGDEFIILLEDVNQFETQDVAKRIIDAFSKCFTLDQDELFTTPSIGISLYPKDGEDSNTLIKNADVAMYLAKQRGKNNYQFFIKEPEEILTRKSKIEIGLRRAIENKEFFLHFQPKVNIETNCITGAEALIRWSHPAQGIISPAEFIPFAEEMGLIVEIGEWVLETVFQQLKKWMYEGKSAIPISVNVSSQQLVRSNFSTIVRNGLRRYNIPPELLELEITETSLMTNVELASKNILELSQIGVAITLDDFGTGYSSLSFLAQIELNSIKIDQSFVNGLLWRDGTSENIVISILSLAQSLDMKVIAEGVEVEEQLQFLKTQYCQEAQGYYFSKPIPIHELELIIKDGLL